MSNYRIDERESLLIRKGNQTKQCCFKTLQIIQNSNPELSKKKNNGLFEIKPNSLGSSFGTKSVYLWREQLLGPTDPYQEGVRSCHISLML